MTVELQTTSEAIERLLRRGVAQVEKETEFHNAAAAQEAEENFVHQFSEHKLPANIPEYQLAAPIDILTLMVDAGLAKSKSAARRLIHQGGVSLFQQGEESEAQRISEIDFIVPAQNGAILKVGKLQYIRLCEALT